MGSATRTTDHETIRRWVEERGGIPAIVRGTEGLLRVDFIRGAESGGREDSLEETSWERWLGLFDDNDLSFLYQDEGGSRFFKLVARTPQAARGVSASAHCRGAKDRSQPALSVRERDQVQALLRGAGQGRVACGNVAWWSGSAIGRSC